MRLAACLVFVVCCGAAGPSRAELRRIAAEGAVPVDAAAAPVASLRDAARQRALAAAVVDAGMALLAENGMAPPDGGPPPTGSTPAADPGAALRARVAAALDGNPLDYAARYRVAMDIGLRPRAVIEDPAVGNEYAVRVEAQIDLERVRRRLSSAGLWTPPPPGEVRTYRIELLDLPGLDAMNAMRRAVSARVAARSLLPVEISAGRAVFDLTTQRRPDEVRMLLQGLGTEGVELSADPQAGEWVFRVQPIVAPPVAPPGVAPPPMDPTLHREAPPGAPSEPGVPRPSRAPGTGEGPVVD
jgi:hypothetical protein